MLLYKKGYKYQLAENFTAKVPLSFAKQLVNPITMLDFIDMDDKGTLVIHKGYAWDGPSGPAIDTKSFMRGALIHDALYQLIRNECFKDGKKARKAADKLLRIHCREDGMLKIRAWWVYHSLRIFGSPAALSSNVKTIYSIP